MFRIIVRAPVALVCDLDLLSSADRRLVLQELPVGWEVEWECRDQPLHAILEARALSSGDAVALVGRSVRLTYREANGCQPAGVGAASGAQRVCGQPDGAVQPRLRGDGGVHAEHSEGGGRVRAGVARVP